MLIVGWSFRELFLPQGNIPPTTMLTWDSRPGVVQITESLADLEKALFLMPESQPPPSPSPTDLNRLVLSLSGAQSSRRRCHHESKPSGQAVWAGCHCVSASWSWNGSAAKRRIMQTDHVRISGEEFRNTRWWCRAPLQQDEELSSFRLVNTLTLGTARQSLDH